jgi:CxxC motif-containing protein (DUF1111 family)
MTIKSRIAAAGVLTPLLIVTVTMAGLPGNKNQGQAPSFGDPLAGLSTSQLARFQAGVAEFDGPEMISDGLGPVFNAPVSVTAAQGVACATCHSDPVSGGGSSTQFETRFGRVSNGVFDPMAALGGSLIQNQGIGNGAWGYNFVGEVVPPQANVVARRRTTPLFGLGLVEAVPDHALLMIAAQQQFQFPQVAGRASLVLDATLTDRMPTQMRVGRFGWKAQHAVLLTFGADAYLNEMGITTSLFPTENCPQGNCAILAFNPVPAINDTDASLQQFSDFMAFLAPPPVQPIPQAGRGGDTLFASLGCAICHMPTLQTGRNVVAALNQVEFHPFSDFLLHDMGSLGDGIVQGGTGATEMRTAPLWGLRNVSVFLHDGRATTIEAAILAHDGQGRAARNRFAQLQSSDRARLVAYLKSL